MFFVVGRKINCESDVMFSYMFEAIFFIVFYYRIHHFTIITKQLPSLTYTIYSIYHIFHVLDLFIQVIIIIIIIYESP